MASESVTTFIARWSAATASERSNSQLFLSELCDLLDLPHPDAHRDAGYAFEFPVTQHHPDGTATTGSIDLYKRGCFVLESKQFEAAKIEDEAAQLQLVAEEAGAVEKKKSSKPVRGTGAWDDAMIKARGQAERYARSLPAAEPTPAFLIIVDVGHSFELFADFTQAGKAYLHFPDPRSFRIRLEQLADEKIRERLRLIWTNPAALDPARHSADVTLAVSGHLAELAKSLEATGHSAKAVADFLTRCLFCMFAEDVGLIPENSFTDLLKSIPADGSGFQELLEQLFRELDAGTGKGISVVLRKKLLRFNGGLFADHAALPVNGPQLALLKLAALQNWRNVEPAIFGTLLERALNPRERHKLGAHYTPRAYVERLVLPTVVEPLRAEWESVQAAAITHASRSAAKAARARELTITSRGKQKAGDLRGAKEDYRVAQAEEKGARADLEQACAVVNAFHEHLCQVRVLDPACGSGNFLYVALEHLKRLEGEVLDLAASFGENFRLELGKAHSVDPHQFLGIEINPRAAAITELVLWIGYLQWHFRTHGRQSMPEEPILRKFNNIECCDAVLAYDGEPQPAKDENGKVVTVWDRHSTKKDPVTGREVPDESKRAPVLIYRRPRAAQWPPVDFIVGNPPFIGAARMRESLGDGYAETLRRTYPEVPESVDFVTYWWHKAAGMVRAGATTRFGFITTNSIRQKFGRRVIQSHLAAQPPLSLVFAVPDHPWVEANEGAAVRISMTVGAGGDHLGELQIVTEEVPQEDGSATVTFRAIRGRIASDLTVGAGLPDAHELRANERLAYRGMQLIGSGFILSREEAESLGLGSMRELEKHIRVYRNGRDLTDEPRDVMAIDLFGLSEIDVRTRFPALYQHVHTRVKPDRDQNNREAYRRNWWIHGEPRRDLRLALNGLSRYIATTETAKHRFFQYLSADVLPDNMLVVFALNDAFCLGVLSSRIHIAYALAAGGTLEDRPRYNKSRCFDTFPFPACDEATKTRIRNIAEELDAHRKRVQAQHPQLTLTGMYNVLEKLRAAKPRSTTAVQSPNNQPTILPLPPGEGRGEGNSAPLPGAGKAVNPPIPLTEKEKRIHDLGLVSVLRQLHDELDAAVFAAYGWPTTLTDAEILERLVALNAERAKEEANGLIRWLRPEYQNPSGVASTQTPLALRSPSDEGGPNADKPDKKRPAKDAKVPWPPTLSARVKAVTKLLAKTKDPLTADDVASRFSGARRTAVAEILETLVTMGHAHRGKSKGSYLP